MRKDDINELIAEVKETYIVISDYKKISKPKVKAIFEHLRSCLEYAIQDINIKFSKPNPTDRLYFPYGETLEKLLAVIEKKLPLLKEELPEIYDEIILLHEFNENSSWLKTLCDLTNHAKHDSAIQITHESEVIKSMLISAGGFPLIEIGPHTQLHWSGNTVNGKTTDDFNVHNNEISVKKRGDISVDFKITKDKKILVGGSKLDLLPFLNNAIQRIENFIVQLYEKL
jgi:hypothetical protein